ncbi:MAG: folylpolyglutamate synthase/dihydrofolate synthase family protein [Candidatus Cloacimonadota bacterium]|nr:folylpolyglutamate synthase/dihydrofolate synthase family protein [Candidatus Cloacimonadota bacterium]
MNYQEFLEEIYEKSAGKKKLQLVNITNFFNAIGNPEKKINAVHIAGTNGKGSTAAMVETILEAHGFKTGLNTSPHLVDYNERFRINKKRVGEKKLLNKYLKFRKLHEKYDTSYFEITTAIACQMFLEEKTDYAIMEVGLGGRLDASVLVNAVITAITNIDYDHTNSLGSTLEKIAGEKAGILKEGIPVCVGKMPKEAKAAILSVAKKKKSPILDVENEIKNSSIKLEESGCSYNISIPQFGINYKNIRINLAGLHQVDNSSLALLMCAALANKFGWKLEEKKVKNGLKNILWDGRMQKIREQPTILVDGAHNPAGIEKLVFNLTHIYEYRKLIVVIAILYDKDFRTMIKKLSKIVDMFVICKSHSDRAAETKDLSDETGKYTQNYIVEEDIQKALQKAKEIADSRDLICVTGSLYTIGEVLSEEWKTN